MTAAARTWAPNEKGIRQAVESLRRGQVIGFPTDTVYGIGAMLSIPGAVIRLSEIKGRAPAQPLILMVAQVDAVGEFAAWTAAAQDLADRFWPGPLTLILAATELGGRLGGAGTVGVRVPAHPVALELLGRSGPLATSSANRHGQPPVPDAATALGELPGLAGALADPAPVRKTSAPSSILDLTRNQPVLIREGRLSGRELGVSAPERDPGIRRD
ncbi:MAG TPA: L-threonylcarbamoyladenylate synthase [Candidatus Acidoferrales bacterium]|nr:L-threonylcarbamoyladenylate synthase [Candidatus Acidoferrales bacterium]